ncbi:MAG: 6-hydroxynicotinate reductase [Rhodobacteraceae bacterium]|nr:6-hydroxynicotinate reductase [Paracoccaceae bacterium]
MPEPRASATTDEKIRCDACPVMCYIADGMAGACDRYANHGGRLVRLDPLTVIESAVESGSDAVPFLDPCGWDGDALQSNRTFVTAIGAGTTYPDYKPAPFIVSSDYDGTDMVTVVTEGIFSYCGVKVKIDTDRDIGPERAEVRSSGEVIGHVTSSEYGSKMLSLGGVEHLTGGTKTEGRITCESLLQLCNRAPLDIAVDRGANLRIQAACPPVINGEEERRMRVGCGSAAIGMFARQWAEIVDEVIVVDDHITGVLTEHEAGRQLDLPPAGIRVNGRRSTPGRYFQAADSGSGWGGTNIENPLEIIRRVDPKIAWPGLRLLMVSTTGEQCAYFQLDEDLNPTPADMPQIVHESVVRIAENCEPSLCSILFMGGAGGSLRAGVTENPIGLTRSVRELLTRVTCGGVEAFIWPGGGITFMVDVADMPDNSFGYVPTPALVAPIEFTMRKDDYLQLGGHEDRIRPVESVLGPQVRRVKKSNIRPGGINPPGLVKHGEK